METPKTKALMEERLRKASWLEIHSNSYFFRIENNHFVLLEVCEALKKRGVTCFVTRDDYERERTSHVYGYMNGQRVMFGFSEVPYRWWLNNDSIEHGDCRGIQGRNGFDFPYEIEEIIGGLRPCSRKELDDYERKKANEFYIRL